MNDEIKKILNKLEELDDLSSLDYKTVLDYITNLQQKYEEADYDRHKLFEENERLKEYYDLMVQFNEKNLDRFCDYKSRCEKAIEYIKEHNPSDIGICGDEKKYYYTLDEDSVDNLLNILQNGSDSQ